MEEHIMHLSEEPFNWIKEGRIEAFQLPGGNNRVTRENLIKFMKQYGIPLHFLDESTKKRILVVDDDQEILNILEQAFQKEEDFMVRTARTGFQTGMVTREFRPHAILLDIALEDIDGRDVCRTIREDAELSETRIIAISGVISPEEECKLFEVGFDYYLKKPFDIKEMISKIRELLNM